MNVFIQLWKSVNPTPCRAFQIIPYRVVTVFISYKDEQVYHLLFGYAFVAGIFPISILKQCRNEILGIIHGSKLLGDAEKLDLIQLFVVLHPYFLY